MTPRHDKLYNMNNTEHVFRFIFNSRYVYSRTKLKNIYF